MPINRSLCSIYDKESMAISSSWLCTSSTQNMLVKIVHPGGHVELHDRPVLAAEVMHRNPRCCVAHPHVFQQPWAIVEPETTLMPGNNFYVVPLATIRKLQQRNALKNSPSSGPQTPSTQSSKGDQEDQNNGSKGSTRPKPTHAAASNMKPNTAKRGCFSDGNCFICLLRGAKIQENGDIDSIQEIKRSPRSRSSRSSSRSSSSINSPHPDHQAKVITRKRRNFQRHGKRGLPKKQPASLDPWQPSMESIKEESL